MNTQYVPNETLVVGDVIRVCGIQPWYTIERIEPYAGLLPDIVFAIAHFRKGAGPVTRMSLTIGGYSERLAFGTLQA